MRAFVLMVAAVGYAAFSLAQASAQSALTGADVSSEARGDWRHHEIVRTYRDDEGCHLTVISYHHADGGVDVLKSRDCRKF
jgi:hypothetical protein